MSGMKAARQKKERGGGKEGQQGYLVQPVFSGWSWTERERENMILQEEKIVVRRDQEGETQGTSKYMHTPLRIVVQNLSEGTGGGRTPSSEGESNRSRMSEVLEKTHNTKKERGIINY